MIKIEFPANDPIAARAMEKALGHIADTLEGAPSASVAEALGRGAPPLPTASYDLGAPAEADAEIPQRELAPAFVVQNEKSAPASIFDEPEAAEVTGSGRADVDDNGVPKDPRFCATAKQPFYTSGKRLGQWKKRQGVSDEDYDAWYASQLEPGAAQETLDHAESAEPAPVDTTAAFSTAPAATAEPAPEHVGALFGWCASQTASGALQEIDIGNAYIEAGVDPQDLWKMTPAQQSDAVAKLYAILVAKVRS